MAPTGNIRTSNYQSASNGVRTWGSILASSAGGAGSFRRIYHYHATHGSLYAMNLFGRR
jgi:hypothetical protein